MQIPRRNFTKMAAAAIICVRFDPAISRAQTVTLRALFAAQVPSSIEVPAYVIAQGARIFEKRAYSSAIPLEILARHGIIPARMPAHMPARIHDATYLFPFASLQARQKAWDRLNADSAWHAQRGNVQVREISLYC